jgi:signal transduction histidine kinase
MHCVKSRWLNSLSLKVLSAFLAGTLLSILLIVVATVTTVSARGDWMRGADVAAFTRDMASMLQFDSNGVPTGLGSCEPAPMGIGDCRDSVIGPDGSGDDFAPWLHESLKHETAYRVLDVSGNVVLSSAAGDAFWPTTGAALRLESGRFEFEHGGALMRAVTEVVEHDGRTWFLQNAVSTRFLDLGYSLFAVPFAAWGVLLFSLVLLVVFSACAYLTLTRTLKPLRDASEAAAAVSPNSLHTRLQTDAVPMEIVPLVRSFNLALDRLERGYRIQREFLATAAHELKTPLALIRGQIELGVKAENRDVLLRDISRMGRQVQQLLHLAEACEVQNYEFAELEVEELAREVATFLERLADQNGVRVQIAVEPGVQPLLADRGALFTLLKNLLENSIQHSHAGGVVSLHVGSSGISVRDQGAGVAVEDLPRLFARFWRSADRRDLGAGLGLSICREIVTAHGWTLTARRAEPGMIFEIQIVGGKS